MAENKKGRGFLETAAVASPMLVGAGLTAKAAVKEGVYSSSGRSSVEMAMETLRDISRRTPRIFSAQEHIDYINQNAKFFSSTQGAESARRAWLEAVRAADPLAAVPLQEFTARIKSLPTEQIPSAIADIMSRHQSSLTSRIYSKYYRNLNILQQQEMAYDFVTASPLKFNKTIRALPGNLEQRLENIAHAINGNLTSSLWTSRPGWEEGIGSWALRIDINEGGQVKFMLPSVQEGMLVEGSTLRTRYIAPQVGIFDPATGELERISRSEFFLREVEGSIVPDIRAGRLKTTDEIEKAIQEVRARTIHTLEVVPNLPLEQQTIGMREYVETRSKAIDIMLKQERRVKEGAWKYTSAFRTPTETEVSQILAQHDLYGGVSPTNLARGRLQTINLAERAMVPSAVSWGRRPEAAIREYNLTRGAANMLSKIAQGRYERYKLYEATDAVTATSHLSGPSLKTLYIDPEMYAEYMNKVGLGEGEALASSNVARYIGFETTRGAHLTSLRRDLVDKLLAGENINVKPGEILGWTQEGNPFLMERGMRDVRAVAHESAARGPYYSLYYRDVQRMRSADKFFGDIKGLIHLSKTNEIRRGIQQNITSYRFLSDVDMIASMDELRKDTGKHAKQILTSMGELANWKAKRLGSAGLVKRGLVGLEEFAADPMAMSKLWEREAVSAAGVYSHKAYVRQAMEYALAQIDASAREFGAIFGAAPSVFGAAEAEQLAREAIASRNETIKQLGKKKWINIPEHLRELQNIYIKAMQTGTATGVAHIAYGGPGVRVGAGAIGSLEPRAFDILRGPAFKGIGESLTSEFAARLAYTNPETLAVQRAVSRSLASMAGEVAPETKAQVWKVGQQGFKYSPQAFEEFIARGGGYIDPGQGLRSIYVPGAEVLQAMRPYKIGEQTVHTQLAGMYHQLAKRLEPLYSDISRISVEQAQEEIDIVARELWKHAAPGGKGMGAVLRGKVEGSRFFTGVSRAGKMTANQLAKISSNAMVVGLPRTAALDMFKEMERMYGESAMRGMKESYMRGEEIGGILARHPFIGEFSMQPIRFRRIEASAEHLLIPEIASNIRFKLGSGELVEKRLRLGPLIGLAGDKDADIYSAMLVSPDNERLVKNATLNADSEFLRRYTQHQVRYQLIKAGKGDAAADAGMTIKQLMAGDIRKLGTTQNWVPKLSVELSSAKRAIRAFGKGAAAADAATLLEWLEQTPISAKHLSAAEVAGGSLEATLSTVTSSLRYRDANSLRRVVESIVKDDAVSKELLTGSISIEEGAENLARITGGGTLSKLKGINIEEATNTLMQAMNEHAVTGEARRAELSVARGAGITVREIPEMVGKSIGHMASGFQGVFANVTRAATSASNIIASAGRSAIRNYKPLALGFAASLGVAAVLSSPRQLVGPGRNTIPPAKFNMKPGKAINRMKSDQIMPMQQSLGNPKAPNMLSAQRAMVQTNQDQKYFVNATAGSNASSIVSQLAGASGISGSVNIHLRDSREQVNSYAFGNRIY